MLQELCVNLRRKAKRPLDVRQVREIVTDYLAWDVVAISGESILEALEIEGRFQISFRGALILQAAESSGARILYSEDLSSGQSYGAVRVVNPLEPNQAPPDRTCPTCPTRPTVGEPTLVRRQRQQFSSIPQCPPGLVHRFANCADR